MINSKGYRGYIGSREYMGQRTPQHVQNLVIRDYCKRLGRPYLLSATEYAMDNCYVMFEEVLGEIGKIEGIVLYSIFMLPNDRNRRLEAYNRVLSAGASVHGAVEAISVTNGQDVNRVEDILRINSLLDRSDGKLEALV